MSLCGHIASPAVTGVAEMCRATAVARGAMEPGQPRTQALQLQIDTVPPDLSRGIEHLGGTEGEMSVRPPV